MNKKPPYTPMMMQYLNIKEKYKDTLVFYRLGDFYEMFFDDAKTASKELDLVLTGRDAGSNERVPMCGVPHHSVNGYIERLIKKGYKVALVEQMEDPLLAKGIVERDVVQVITPGTLISVGLEENKSNYIVSIDESGVFYLIAICELSTGELKVMNLEKDEDRLISELDALDVKEIVLNSFFNQKVLVNLLTRKKIIISIEEENEVNLDYEGLMGELKDIRQMRVLVRLINYLLKTQKRALDYLIPATIIKTNQYLNMDAYTRYNLELTRTIRSEDKFGSLLWVLDKTKTAMGARLMKQFILKPLFDINQINKRLDIIDAFLEHFIIRNEVEKYLNEIYDLNRLIAKVSYGNANGRDLIQLKNSLKVIPFIKESLIRSNNQNLIDLAINLEDLNHIVETIDLALSETPPITIKEGGMFKKGFNSELDELKDLSEGGKEWISQLEISEREKTGIKNLKVGFNKVFGFYIEVSRLGSELIKPEFNYERKQTLANSERYITPQLKEKEALVLSSEEKIVKLEYELFNKLKDEIKKETRKIQNLGDQIAFIDVLRSLTQIANDNRYIRPTFNEQGKIDIKQGRHPVIEKVMDKNTYVPNDVYLDEKEKILLITGPNMGGKSTYLRQVAILIIMAQMGSFIPSDEANISLIDAIFTRIGASDDLVSGQSTFMVEMLEANNALKNATTSSLIVFDELGRGTSTYDGMALAQSIIEYIAINVKAKTLFSTHYHELTKLEATMEGLVNINVLVHEENDHVTFLYKIAKGPANKSYGINVARMAGLPDTLLNRAGGILKELENKKVDVSLVRVETIKVKEDEEWLKELKQIEPLNMSPLDAINYLYKLHKTIKKN